MEASRKKKLILLAKLAASLAILGIILRNVMAGDGSAELGRRLTNLSWAWVGVAFLIQVAAVACNVVRWRLLLVGQGIHAPWRHLIGSFLVGRFFGAFTPAGMGLGGYRIYDIAVLTGKTARSTAAVAIDSILGWVGFGAVIIVGSLFGARYIGTEGVWLLDLGALALVSLAIVLLSRPTLFQWLSRRLPHRVQARLRTTVDAVCAYRGRGGLLFRVTLLAMGTHTLNCLLYVAAAQALGTVLGVGDVFFVTTMQKLATWIPLSINGVGIREGAAVFFYTMVGVPAALAVLIALLGFAVEMVMSATGGFVFLSRRHGTKPVIVVDDAGREDIAHAAIEVVPEERWPRVRRGAIIGLGAGLLAGAVIGLVEAGVVLASSRQLDLSVLPYGTAAYGVLGALAGGVSGAVFSWTGRLMRRAAVPEARAFARLCAALVAGISLGLGAFRVRRDVFHEELAWKSVDGALVLLACALAAMVIYFAFASLLGALMRWRMGQFLLRPWGSPVVVAGAVAVTLALAMATSGSAHGVTRAARPAAPAQAGNIIFIVVDTLRADRIASYGYASGRTPNLDALAGDAIRFDQAFANSSWTRPSFASMLTGRYASSHNVMLKADALPDALVTLPEALVAAGYSTAGFVTNYNIAPFCNFQQGFDAYHYLEPNFVLGANDTSAKLLVVQFLRQRIELMRERFDMLAPGTAYQDAAVVNRSVLAWLDRAPPQPFFLFAAYMDPHDPYFEHPYNGVGYSRAAHQTPAPSEAPRLSQLYDGEVTFWDEHFGHLVAELRRRGIYDQATIIVTSDHGEEFFEHGGYWHGTTLYDELIRVPLIVKLPFNERGGSVARQWVELVDIMPTVLTLSGVEVPPGVQGNSLFEGSVEVFAEENHEGNVIHSLRTRRGTSELKAITANADNPRGLPETELFRVDQDPGERVDLANEQVEVREIAVGRLDQRRENARTGAVERQDSEAADPAQLRALGYAN